MKKTVDAVIFDLGRVIVNLHPEKGLFGRFFGDGENFDEMGLTELMQNKYIKGLMSGKITSDQFHIYVCRKFGLELDYEEFVQQWTNIFSLKEDTAELLKELRDKVKLGILSDTDPLHWNRVRQDYPVLSLIENPTLSYQTGFAKPDKQIYLKAAENTGADIENCLFIDDLLLNVEGAKNAGMDAIQFISAKQVRKELIRRQII